MSFRRAYAILLRRASFPAVMIVQTVGLALIGVVMLAAKGADHPSDALIYRGYAVEFLQGKVPYRDFAVEYPPLALPAMILPALVGGTSPRGYVPAVILENLALMIATAFVLVRLLGRESTGTRTRRAALQHVVLAGALGLILLWRFDPFIALLCVLSFSAHVRGRPMAAGVWAGLGIAAKLFPLFLVAVLGCDLLARRRPADLARLALGCGLVVVGVFGPAMLLTDGKLLDFLKYHALRGVQIESIPGGLLLLAGKMGGPVTHIEYTFGAFHLASSWARTVLPGLMPLSLLVVVAALARAGMVLRDARGNMRVLASMIFFVLLVAILTSKVLSPQYLIWLIPFAPFLRSRQVVLFAAICALTVLLYPLLYQSLLQMRVASILLLNVRNGLMVVLALWLARGTSARPSLVPAVVQPS